MNRLRLCALPAGEDMMPKPENGSASLMDDVIASKRGFAVLAFFGVVASSQICPLSDSGATRNYRAQIYTFPCIQQTV